MSQLQSLQEVRGRYESLKEETATLRTMIEKQEKVAEGFGDKVKQIHRLKRDVELKQQLYEELVQRYEMAQLTGSLGEFEESKRVKIIDRPYTPSRPSNLPSIIFVIAGVFAGIGLGIGLAILMELFDSTVRNPRDIKAPPKVLVLTQTY